MFFSIFCGEMLCQICERNYNKHRSTVDVVIKFLLLIFDNGFLISFLKISVAFRFFSITPHVLSI